MSSNLGLSHVGPSPTRLKTCANVDTGEHTKAPEDMKDSPEEYSEGKEAAVDSMSESTICALVEEKRKQLDEEIAAFKAAKDEEFRTFERELRDGRDVSGNKKKGRGDTETFIAGRKRQRGVGGYAVSSSPSRGSNSPKAPETQQSHYANESKGLRTHYRPEDQSPQTPPHEHELEFQGLFTPSFMTLLDYGGHRSSTRPASERPVHTPSSESPPSPSSHLKQGGSAPLAQPAFTRPALPKLTLPHQARSSSFPPARSPQQDQPTPTRSGSSTSLHSSIRNSNEDQKPRAPKQVKFKFDNIIVLPATSYDISQEPIAAMSHNEKQSVGLEEVADGTQKGIQKTETKSTQKACSTSPLSEPSPLSGSNFGNFASESKSESGPSGLLRNTNHQQSSQVEGNGSLDGLGGRWSTIKEKEVGGGGGGGRSVQDESAEIIARAEYEEADEDDYDDGGIFDLDETMPDLPEPEEPEGKKEKESEAVIAKRSEKTTSPVDMPLFDPSSLRGYDLSLVVPTTVRSAVDHYSPSLGRTRAHPAAIVGSAPADLVFGSNRPENTLPSTWNTARGTSGIGKSSASSSRDFLLGDAGDEPSITWSSMRRHSSTKYEMEGSSSDGNGLPTKSKRHLYRHGAASRERYDDSDEDVIVSPMAFSLPVQIPASPLMGYTDNGDMDSNSYTPKAPASKAEKQSVTPKNAKNASDKKKGAATCPGSSSPGSTASETVAIPANNEPTATNIFSLSTTANISSVDNPITDQFATATIGGLHRNAFGTDSPISCSSSTTPNNFMSNPFVGGSYAPPGATAMAEDMGDIGSYVGSIDGCSGYDVADRSSYLKLRRGRNAGEPQSFSERMLLEDEMKTKQAKVRKAVRRATRP